VAVALDTIGVVGLAAMGVFLLVLVVGFVYEWKKGPSNGIRGPEMPSAASSPPRWTPS